MGLCNSQLTDCPLEIQLDVILTALGVPIDKIVPYAQFDEEEEEEEDGSDSCFNDEGKLRGFPNPRGMRGEKIMTLRVQIEMIQARC
jgi:hypothetical protein